MSLESFGLIKTSLLDYPERVAAVLFTSGCNLRCPWCHNPELIPDTPPPNFVGKAEVFAHLRKRAGVLGGVVLTGGEPLWHQDLPVLIEQITGLGLPVKLDTNGTFPRRLAELRGRIDFVAMDLKLAPSRYHLLGLPDTAQKVHASAALIREHFPRHEFRTAWVPGLNRWEDLPEMAEALGHGTRLTLSAFRPGKTFDPAYRNRRGPTAEELREVAARLTDLGVEALVRPA